MGRWGHERGVRIIYLISGFKNLNRTFSLLVRSILSSYVVASAVLAFVRLSTKKLEDNNRRRGPVISFHQHKRGRY